MDVITLTAILTIIWLGGSAIAWAWREDDKREHWYEGKIKTNFNLIALIYNIKSSVSNSISKLKPKTELDRQIAEEEKEIKFLTEQKAKINKLERLKSKKDSLYQEVNVDAQNEDMDVYRCKECGSTKVTGYNAFDTRIDEFCFMEHCSDCATPINEMERVK